MAASKQTKRKVQEELIAREQGKREIIGICFIAIGLFLGASLYSDAVGVIGQAIGSVFFGLFGLCGYAVPVAVIALGVMSIIRSSDGFKASTFVMMFALIFAILSLFHIATRADIQSNTAIEYFSDGYQFGTIYRLGGGIVGSFLAYPALMYIGKTGSYILFIAIIVVIILIITKISLKKAGEQISSNIRQTFTEAAQKREESKQQLYTENLSGASTVPAKSKSKKKALAFDENSDFIEVKQTKEPKPTAKRKTQLDKDNTLVKNASKELELMPISGTIKKNPVRDIDDFISPYNEYGASNAESEFVNDDFIQGYETEAYSGTRFVNAMPEIEAEAAPQAKPQKQPKKEEASIPVAPVQPEAAAILEYQKPPITLLNSAKLGEVAESPNEKAKLLIDALASFNIACKIINISVGPVITRFELQPAQGIRVSRITSLSNDIALALAAPRVRIEAPIPGKAAIGVEIPNKNTASVCLRDIIEAKEFQNAKSSLTFALGKDIAGKVTFADLDKMPHLLVAGATGSGKSVCINDIICSIAYRSSPTDVRMILIDPKVVEMQVYAPLPHLLLPVVTNPKRAAGALKWAVSEMEQRYQKMAKLNARDMSRYNMLVEDPAEKLPKIVIIIDELADLMMVAAKEVEESICRIAQLGRASGIHLIVATQRPSVDVITGLIKANIPSRIALAVSSATDSRVIMDTSGAEKLLGKGDMLFHANGADKPLRVQCAYITDEEVERVMDFFAQNSISNASSSAVDIDDIDLGGDTATQQGNGKQEDDLLAEAVRIVLESGQASISMIQRRLRVGYARAARLIDIMEQKKIVSGFDGSKPRKLLIDKAAYDRMFGVMQDGGNAPEESDD